MSLFSFFFKSKQKPQYTTIEVKPASVPPIDTSLGSTYQDDLLMEDLIDNEGLVLHAYLDTKKLVTIGIGTMIDKNRGGGITKEEAIYLAKNRLKKAAQQLDEHLPWWRELSLVRQRLMVELCYNMGIGSKTSGLLSFVNTLPAIQRRDYLTAAKGFQNSKWARDVGPIRSGKMIKMLLEG